MGLDILSPVHIKKVGETGTMGIISASDFDPLRHSCVDPAFWSIVDGVGSFTELSPGGDWNSSKDRCGAFIGNKLYLFGGEKPDYWKVADLLVYTVTNTATGAGTWSEPGGGLTRKEACMGTNGTDIFVYGGNDGGPQPSDGPGEWPTNTLQKYTVATNTWSVLADGGTPNVTAPYPTSRHAVCVYNNYLYAIGGWYTESAPSAYNQFWKYNLASTGIGGWTKLAPPTAFAPGGLIDMYIQPWNGKIYVFGGYKTWAPFTREQDKILIYDIATNTWSQGVYSVYLSSEGDSYVFDNKVYIQEPYNVGGVRRNMILVYDLIKNCWSYRLPGGVGHSQCAVAGHPVTGDMYIYGNDWGNQLTMWKRNDITLAIRKV